ncbi:MAG: hypothetical protein ACTHU0_25785 [Kofleriaceae bacterium]
MRYIPVNSNPVFRFFLADLDDESGHKGVEGVPASNFAVHLCYASDSAFTSLTSVTEFTARELGRGWYQIATVSGSTTAVVGPAVLSVDYDDGVDPPAQCAEVLYVVGSIDPNIALIREKTDNLPVDPADASDVAAAFAIVPGAVDAVLSASHGAGAWTGGAAPSADQIADEVATRTLNARVVSVADGAIAAAGVAADLLEAIRDTVLDTVLDTGRTFRGFLRRMYALNFGKVTGLSGPTSTVVAYKADGITPEYSVALDAAAGTRQSAGNE